MPGCPTRSALLFAIRVVAESGLLYTVTGIAVLAAVFIHLSPNGSQQLQLPLIILVAIVRHTPIGNVYHHDLFIASSFFLSPGLRMIFYGYE